MSDLYNKASLVMTPQLVDTGKVYSIKPEDRKGDFTFTRSSAATRVNADGNIEKETQNLLLQSNSFNTTWATYLNSLTSGQSGYDGTSDAWLIERSGAFGSVFQNLSSSGVRSYSVYAKAGSYDFLALRFRNTSNAYRAAFFDLSSGTLGSVDSNIIKHTIEDVGGGWYRCQIAFNDSAANQVMIYPSDVNNGIGNSGTGNILIQDAQLEQGLVARDYIETTTTAVEGGITDNVPRLDYTDSSCPALLLEPQRTNALPHSEYFGTGYTLSNASLIENDAISPEGLQNATKIYPTSSGNYRNIKYSALSPATGLYTFSIFAKAGELDHLVLIDYDGSGVGVDFNLSTGVATNSATTPFDFVGMVDYGNGWYRCIATATDPYFYWILSDNGAVSVTANGTDGLYIWGAQAETASYATSYIPTYGTSVTRNADRAQILNTTTDVLSQTAFTLFFEADLTSDTTNNFKDIVAFRGASKELRFETRTDNSVRVQSNMITSGDSWNSATIGDTDNKKFAMTFTTSQVRLYADGSLVSTYNGAYSSDLVHILFINSTSLGVETKTSFKQYILFTTALSNQEAIALTTI
jgi:hypothetical protein